MAGVEEVSVLPALDWEWVWEYFEQLDWVSVYCLDWVLVYWMDWV